MIRILLLVIAVVVPSAARARDAGDPIRMVYAEGDVAGLTTIHAPDGAVLGYVDFTQTRRGDVIRAVRIARFRDGSSDEDQAEAQVGRTLRAIRGRTIIRDAKGRATVDITIDVRGGRITGFSGLGKDRETYDEHVELPDGTYWGPLIFMVIKNFEQNAEDGKVVFRTVVPTPKPRVLSMEVERGDAERLDRPGGRIGVVRFTLRPTINPLIDPIVQHFAPATDFFIVPEKPPALARFAGPRNYAGQAIVLE
jgi:hypothetical protein